MKILGHCFYFIQVSHNEYLKKYAIQRYTHRADIFLHNCMLLKGEKREKRGEKIQKEGKHEPIYFEIP